ncbi:unnamed protein product [Microthlaspi erraticum]|uniref:Endonuclease/exonuclease/phosphatase domain-containing protein n=1 Tax=Microthlaspi erraticum TaxID=1685480 RepID=A0A6D2J1W5_9BRAS|nr:unnamed protein product [Microthlaspi erraticum]
MASPITKGNQASRKLQTFRVKPSPKKKSGTGKTSKPSISTTSLPRNEIDIEATIAGTKVFMSFVYGDPVIENHNTVWDRLNQLSLTRQGPWFMIGDFNELVGNHEKRGRRKRSKLSFLPLRHATSQFVINEERLKRIDLATYVNKVHLPFRSKVYKCATRTLRAVSGGVVTSRFVINEERLKRIDLATYVNKVHLPFRSKGPVKRAWAGVVEGWVTFREVFPKPCE